MRHLKKVFGLCRKPGEELYSAFLGVPIQRVGEKLGVLVVQSKQARAYSEDEIYALEVVAMVLAEMTELGAFSGEGGGGMGRAAQATGAVSRQQRSGRRVRRPGLAARTARGGDQPGGR